MDQVRPLAASVPTPAPKRRWVRFSLAIQLVEQKPSRIFSVETGPYSCRINVAATAQVLRHVGMALMFLLSVSHPGLWKLVQMLIRAMAG